MVNKRLTEALKWCKENHIKETKQLSLFAKLHKREEKLNKKLNKKGSKNGDFQD